MENQTIELCQQKSVSVVKRNDIEAVNEVMVDKMIYALGEHRDFRHHFKLGKFIPESGRFSISWTKLAKNEILQVHFHPTKSMIVICKGEARLLGEMETVVSEGDIVIVPPYCRHGFIADQKEDLHALSIQFDGLGLYENISNPRVSFEHNNLTLQSVLEYNHHRFKEHSLSTIFEILSDDTLKDNNKKQLFLSLLLIWSRYFQRIIHMRQATCSQEPYRTIFSDHFQEEFGHDSLLEKYLNKPTEAYDPIIEATACWFLNKMITSTDLEKIAIVHFVLESSAHVFHTKAVNLFKSDQISKESGYFDIHNDVDESHSKIGIDLLLNQTPEIYKNLYNLVKQSWDMLETMLNRIAYLVKGV